MLKASTHPYSEMTGKVVKVNSFSVSCEVYSNK